MKSDFLSVVVFFCCLVELNSQKVFAEDVFQSNKIIAKSCPVLSREWLRNRLVAAAKSNKKLRIVFFSTWCGDCSAHLQELQRSVDKSVDKDKDFAKNEFVVAVAVFDTQKKVEKMLNRLDYNFPCFVDDGLAKKLGVKIVPAERNINLQDME